MSNYNNAPRQQSQGDQTIFSVIESFVHEGDAWTGNDQLRILEPQTVFVEIAVVLRLIPFVLQCSVYVLL